MQIYEEARIGPTSEIVRRNRTNPPDAILREVYERTGDKPFRKSVDRVRITTQLINAETGVHLWAERYDRMLGDIFALQDEIALSVVGAIEPNLRKVEIERVKRKRPDSLDAYDLLLRALPYMKSYMVDGATAAIPLLQKALELEPDYAGAHALLARCFHFRFSRGGLSENDQSASIHHARAPQSRVAMMMRRRSRSLRWSSGLMSTMSRQRLSYLIAL